MLFIKLKEKEEIFRKYFYSNLTESDIKAKLDLNYKQYNKLLKRTKQYYGLPLSYRRTPQKYFKYDKNAYYILECNINEFTILGYYPVEEFAEEFLKTYDKKRDYRYFIKKASDENLIKLLDYGYVVLGWNWEKLLSKTNISYGVFYKLFNQMKKDRGMNTNREERYVYKIEGGYKVMKYLKGKSVNFGFYEDKEDAIRVRDYLESIGWSRPIWDDTKKRFK